MRRTGALASVFSMLVLGLAACGGSGSDDERRELASRSIAQDVEPPEDLVVSEREIRAVRDGTVEQALLRYWSNLQYSAIDAATGTYSAGLRKAVGTVVLAEALKSQASFYRSHKPRIRSVRTVGGRTNVRFVVVDAQGQASAQSMTWRRIAGRWQILYDPALDAAIQASIQYATQVALDPNAQRPAKQAIQAGFNAGRLQSQYLERVLADEDRRRERPPARATPTPTPTPSPSPDDTAD